MKTSSLLPFSLIFPLFIMLLSFVIQACEDHEVPGNPGEFPQELSSRIFYALSDNNTIYQMDVAGPGKVGDSIKIETLSPGEKIFAIDFRPATGELYAVSTEAIMYSVNVNRNRTVAATPVNKKIEIAGDYSASIYGLDFNPVTDMLRIVTNKGENISISPKGASLNGAVSSGVSTPDVSAIAYSNNYSGAKSTVLYGIDPVADKLVRYENEDASSVNAVGDLRMDIAEVGGFDISPRLSNTPEHAIATVRIGDQWELHYVNLATGQLKKLGDLAGRKIIGIAIPTPVAYAVDKRGKLLAFNPSDRVDADPGRLIAEKQITGITPGDSIVGIDLAVQNARELYAVASDSKLYELDPTNGKATFVKDLPEKLKLSATGAFGVDIEPYDNRLRIVTGTVQNFTMGTVFNSFEPHNSFIYNGRQQALDGVAFGNNQEGVKRRQDALLYGIDSPSRNLFKWDTVYNELNLVAQLEPMFDKANGFDIGGYYEQGYGLFKVQGKTKLYEISLKNGFMNELTTIPYDITGFTLGRYLFNVRP